MTVGMPGESAQRGGASTFGTEGMPRSGGWGLACMGGGYRLTPIALRDGAIVGAAEGAPGVVAIRGDALAAQHAQFVVRPDGVYVSDLDTPEGTRVDGVPAGMLGIAHGSVLRMGDLLALFVERDLSSFDGPFEMIGDLVVGPRQRAWVSAAIEHAGARSSFLIHGTRGIGKATLAQVVVRGAAADATIRTVDARTAGSEDMLRGTDASRATVWVVLHIDRLPRQVQSDLARSVRRNAGSMLVGTVVGAPEDAQAEGRIGASLLSIIEGRVVGVPSLEQRREDIPAIALALCERAGIGKTEASIDVMEALARGGWPGGVSEMQAIMRHAFHDGKCGPAAAQQLRRGIPRPTAKVPLPLQEADEDLARARLGRALDRASGTVAVAARELRMSRQSFYRELRRLRMEGGRGSSSFKD